MFKQMLQYKSVYFIIIASVVFISGCAGHQICPTELREKCSFCKGTGVHEYQTDFLGHHSSIMRCHKCKGTGEVCLKFKDPVKQEVAKK